MDYSQEYLSLLLKTKPKEFIERLSEGMTGTIPILLYLSTRQDREVLSGELADDLEVSTARIAVILARMQKRGLVEKYKPVRDKRKTIVRITKEGMETLDKAKAKLEAYIDDRLSILNPEEKKTLFDIVKKIITDIRKYGTVQRAVLGVSGNDVSVYYDQMKEKGEEVDLGTMQGAYIYTVEDGGAGAEAGLQKGDVITAIDGKNVTKMAELQEYLANKRPGDKVTITFLRDKKKKTATVTLKNQQGNTDVVKNADLDVLGGNFREINNSEKQQLNISTGLVVMKVNNGVLKDAGINKGFIIQKVNDEPMKTIADLQKAVRDASTSKDPVLYIQGIYPTGKKAYFAVPLQND